MPELVKSKVGSFFNTKGAEGTILWPSFSKNSRNFRLIVLESIAYNTILTFVAAVFLYIYEL